ncbi:MAG TPA: ABC transporter substrate-binding protein, partial [Anaerolineae bacterium]
MRSPIPILYKLLALALLAVCLVSCGGQEMMATAVAPTPTNSAVATDDVSTTLDERDFIVIAADAPNPPFTDFDEFGNVSGFDSALVKNLATEADFEYEFVVTPYEGVLDNIAAKTNRDFDAVISNLPIPDVPREGIVYTEPYLEVGQVLVVLADEDEIQSYRDVQPGMTIGVQSNSMAEETARAVLGLSETDLVNHFETSVAALQALIDETVDAVIVDNYTANHFVQTSPEQLKIAGGEGRDAWINSQSYGIAVAADNVQLLARLNEAIEKVKDENVVERLTVAWLIPSESLNPGESRVRAPANELRIGLLGQLTDMDPAGAPDLIGWEVKNNTMSGLFMFTSNNELLPVLATAMPLISDDKLEYTVSLRRGLRFPDGSELTADDVKWSIDRARALGSFLVNDYLKDSDEDNFADDDAVQVIDQHTVKFVLQQPTAYFPALLATPHYFPISNECYVEASDPASSCGGLGPYTIVNWEHGVQMQLQANPEWPGRPAPAFENIELRFYDDIDSLRRSLEEFQSIDMAWTGLPYSDFLELRDMDIDGDGSVDFTAWEGPTVFKSYLIFEQSEPPWDSEKVRRAVAYAIDRDALASQVFAGSRQPLFSPVPDSVFGHVPVLPQRNLQQARALLLEEGYSQSTPLGITIWYTNDGRYSQVEEAYANAIKAQLEETGVFQVTLSGAPSDVFRTQIAQCNYPAYLIGWPS